LEEGGVEELDVEYLAVKNPIKNEILCIMLAKSITCLKLMLKSLLF
jgi:hypothetical protein